MVGCRLEQFFWIQAEPANGRVHSWPMLVQKFLPFTFYQQIARAGFNEHAKTSPLFDELLVDEFLVGFEDSERIDSILGCDIAHRRQRIAFFEDAVENHMDDAITKLAVNRLTIIPFTVHDSSNVPDSVGEGGSRHCSVRLLRLIW